jgi:hypothetical protein
MFRARLMGRGLAGGVFFRAIAATPSASRHAVERCHAHLVIEGE